MHFGTLRAHARPLQACPYERVSIERDAYAAVWMRCVASCAILTWNPGLHFANMSSASTYKTPSRWRTRLASLREHTFQNRRKAATVAAAALAAGYGVSRGLRAKTASLRTSTNARTPGSCSSKMQVLQVEKRPPSRPRRAASERPPARLSIRPAKSFITHARAK